MEPVNPVHLAVSFMSVCKFQTRIKNTHEAWIDHARPWNKYTIKIICLDCL